MTNRISKTFTLPAFQRGVHLITPIIENQIEKLSIPETGVLFLHCLHTSCAIGTNENCETDVRTDMDMFFRSITKDCEPRFLHTYEGPDDMPAHINAVLVGNSVSFPIQNGKPVMGTWQGIYFFEFRDRAAARNLVLTVL